MDKNNTIFLAYAREDERYVKRLYNILKENGLQPWMDQENLNPGEDWLKKADEAIKSARFFLACFSNQSKDKSGYFQRELNVALGELEKKASDELYFIPLLIEDVELPNIRVGTMYLRDIHAIAVFEEEGIEKLVHFLKREIHTDVSDVKDQHPVKEVEDTEYQKLTAQVKEMIAQVKGATHTDKGPEKKEDPIQKIKQRTAEGRIDIALEFLKDYVKEHCPEWDNDVIQLSARYHSLQTDYTKDIISQEQYQRQKNRITNAILETVQRLK